MPVQVSPMKLLHTEIDFRSAAIAADFIHRDEWMVNIKSRVLETFRHDRTGELLPMHDEIKISATRSLQVPGRRKQQDAAQEFESQTFARDCQCIFDVGTICCGDVFITDVGPINGQACGYGHKCCLQFLCSEIPCMTVFFREFSQATDEAPHLTGKQFLHHLSFSLLKDVPVGGGRSGKVRINPLEMVKTFAIDKNPVYEIQE